MLIKHLRYASFPKERIGNTYTSVKNVSLLEGL